VRVSLVPHSPIGCTASATKHAHRTVPELFTGGYMIDFWGVGYDIAKRMGIEESIRDASYDIQRLRLLGEDGGAKADVSVDAIRRFMGNDSASLPRSDLAKASSRR
jgi:hypothetical protein